MSVKRMKVVVAVGLVSGSLYLYNQMNTQNMKNGLTPERISFLAKKYKRKVESPKAYDKPKEAAKFFYDQRAPLDASPLPYERYILAKQQMELMPLVNSSKASILPSLQQMRQRGAATKNFSGWDNLGPGNVGGRTRTLAIDPNQPEVMYTAGITGGVWKTTNGGEHWEPLDDFMSNLSVSNIVIDPNNSRILYAATGEGFDYFGFRGDGIFKSTDAGATWQQLANTSFSSTNNDDFYYVNKLIISPNDSNRLYAATRRGIFRSDDAGNLWTQIYVYDTNNYKVVENEEEYQDPSGCLDIVVRKDRSPDVLTASCGSYVKSQLIHSENGGQTWEHSSGKGSGRISLAIAPSNQNIVYALVASAKDSSLWNVLRSDDGGQSWKTVVDFTKKLNTQLLTNVQFANLNTCSGGRWKDDVYSQGWYDNIIKVDPMNENIVWAGGINIFRSDDAGENWALAGSPYSTGKTIHVDHHGIYFHPNYDGINNKTMYVSNDGGLYRTTNAKAQTSTDVCDFNGSTFLWDNLNNNYAVTQFYHGLAYPDGKTYFGGTQDNGTNRGKDSSGKNWNKIWGGDGGYVAVDPNNTNIIFLENTGLSLVKSIDGGKNYEGAINGISKDDDNGFLFITPFLMDPNNSKTLWIGGNTLWRTTDQANTWQQASILKNFGENENGYRFSVTAWAVAKGDSNFVVVGTNQGHIYRSKQALSTDANTEWEQVFVANIPAGARRYPVVSSLAFDPNNKQKLYATLSNFGVDHIVKSTDGGDSWTAIDNKNQANGIPDIPVHVLVVDPKNSKRLFVGTDLGIFVSLDEGATWAVENTGFTNSIVEHLQIIKSSGKETLFAFTHGRGAWRTDLKTPGGRPPANHLPIANDDTVTIKANETVIIDVLANDSDADDDVLKINSVQNPSQNGGAVSHNSQKITYQPKQGFTGVDRFTYTISDPSGATANASVKISIQSNNASPVANDDEASTEKDRAIVIDVLGNDSDADNNSLEIISVQSPSQNGGEVSHNGKQVTYKPKKGFTGSDNFTYSISDKEGGTATGRVNVSVKENPDGGSCFIATAAFGSYLSPDVKVLRDFRDDYLLTNQLGTKFVEYYYDTSPPIADYIAQHENLRMFTRWLLTPLVYSVKYPAGALLFIFFFLLFWNKKKIIKSITRRKVEI